MSKIVHSRGLDGQKWVKYGPRSYWMPLIQLCIINISCPGDVIFLTGNTPFLFFHNSCTMLSSSGCFSGINRCELVFSINKCFFLSVWGLNGQGISLQVDKVNISLSVIFVWAKSTFKQGNCLYSSVSLAIIAQEGKGIQGHSGTWGYEKSN